MAWGTIELPMKSVHAHPWKVTPQEAIVIQKRLRTSIVCSGSVANVRTVAGIDVGFPRGKEVTRAAIAVLHYPSLALCDQSIVEVPTQFPYVPGLLSFREVPAILTALERLRRPPDLLLCDGQGIAHPRRFGIACHLGLLTDIPSIGVAKSRLIGEHEPVPDERGAWVPLCDQGETIGAVLRTRLHVKPLYISSGHRIDLETAIHWVMACTTRFRLPETTRQAHHLASISLTPASRTR